MATYHSDKLGRVTIPEEAQALDRMTATIARLEAANADLLAALRAILGKLGGDMDMHLAAEKAQAHAAIKRAEGS